MSIHRATLTRTFKTEYQPPTGGTTQQEIIERFPAFFVARLRSRPFCPVPVSYTHLDVYKRQVDSSKLFFELGSKGYIGRHGEIIAEKRDAFFAEYPEFISGVGSGKVTDVNKNRREPVRIRKAVYSELKELWEAITQKYYLFYDADLSGDISGALHDILRKSGIFGNVSLDSRREEIVSDGGQMMLREDTGVSYSLQRPLPYNEFLKRISRQTSIPIPVSYTHLRPVMIHRVIFGSIERFIAILTEHYAGAFPLWLNPVQIKILSINERNIEWCNEIEKKLTAEGFRVESDHRSEKLGFKLREAQLQKVPYMIVIGDNEVGERKAAVRSRRDGDLGSMTPDEFIERCKEEIRLKK